MKAHFLNTLVARKRADGVWIPTEALKFWSEALNAMVIVPPWLDPDYACDWDEGACFETDFGSVPRFPIIFDLLGDKFHEPATIHDWVYSAGGTILVYSEEAKGDQGFCHPEATIVLVREVTREEADDLLAEAMAAKGYPDNMITAVHWGVRIGGESHYHTRNVTDPIGG